MKITQLSLKMFLDSVTALDHQAEAVREAAEPWLKIQSNREKWGDNPDPDHLYFVRKKLEDALTEYRGQLAHTYDFMSDKGLVNFEPTGLAANLDETDSSY